MSRYAITLASLVVMATTRLAAQSTPVPVVMNLIISGFRAPDSARMDQAIRSRFKADSSVRVVYRPPRDSMQALAPGLQLEVATHIVAVNVSTLGPRRIVKLTAADVRSNKIIAVGSKVLAPTDSLTPALDLVIGAFTRAIAATVK